MAGVLFPEMYKIVCSLISRQESDVFRAPVNYEQLGLTNYREMIKHPMDLGTIKGKMEKQKYTSTKQIADDVRLVWHNCMLYNRDGSEYYHLADKFSRSFEHAYGVLQRIGEGNTPSKGELNAADRLPTVEDKMALSHDLFKIGNNEIARALTIIEAACPSALARKLASEEVLLNIDALSPICFHSVHHFVMGCILNGGSMPAEGAGGGGGGGQGAGAGAVGKAAMKGKKKTKVQKTSAGQSAPEAADDGDKEGDKEGDKDIGEGGGRKEEGNEGTEKGNNAGDEDEAQKGEEKEEKKRKRGKIEGEDEEGNESEMDQDVKEGEQEQEQEQGKEKKKKKEIKENKKKTEKEADEEEQEEGMERESKNSNGDKDKPVEESEKIGTVESGERIEVEDND